MAHRRVRILAAPGSAPPNELRAVFDAIHAKYAVPQQFSADVEAEARASATSPMLPTADYTDLAFFTIDPVGSTDLDQAMHLQRDGAGHRVRYAIADVPAFVPSGGLVDAEARRRGQTIYAPDRRTPLHPTVISEGAASLLPDQVRPAFVWDLRLDADGQVRSADVGRALVRSVDRLDYASVQRVVDDGTVDERLALLKEVGERRIRLEQARGGASLPLPDQEVIESGDGYAVRLRPPLPAEDWNAQISLMTGMAAARLMLDAGVGIVRTMPAPDAGALASFRRQAAALGADWPAPTSYGAFLRTLRRDVPAQLALIHQATALFRGAGYTAFDGAAPEYAEHAAVAAPYAHVTAPLRRLVDRFGLVACEALCRGVSVPEWVREALPTLPAAMKASDQVANAVDRECTDAVEAAVLQHRVGEEFDAVVVDVRDERDGRVQVLDPPVLAPVSGAVVLGAAMRVRLVRADVQAHAVEFAPA